MELRNCVHKRDIIVRGQQFILIQEINILIFYVLHIKAKILLALSTGTSTNLF